MPLLRARFMICVIITDNKVLSAGTTVSEALLVSGLFRKKKILVTLHFLNLPVENGFQIGVLGNIGFC